ncbi:MAG: hypothetical protein K6F55_05140 [Eubacterium sp.]|nr:hypothetical protein [Eubacterium sp.]
MWERIKFWIKGYKGCEGCCLGCANFETCHAEAVTEIDEREAYERDLEIEAIINDRMQDGYLRTA